MPPALAAAGAPGGAGQRGGRAAWQTGAMNAPAGYREPPDPVFLFDLDGTLIDSVYQHVIAWHGALSRLDIDLSVWRIHRRIGMSGGLFVSALVRETGVKLSEADVAMLQQVHAEDITEPGAYGAAAAGGGRPAERAAANGVAWAIATSGWSAHLGASRSNCWGWPEDRR